MVKTTTWKTTPPAEPGLYIACTCNRADFVRAWTGKHWTGPAHVGDLLLPGRMPRLDGPPADLRGLGRGVRIRWLERVTVDAEGFVSWGGLLDACPLKRGSALVDVKLRSGARSEWSVPARGLRWRHDGSVLDPMAYRVAAWGV
jgi:hypothetical protein